MRILDNHRATLSSLDEVVFGDTFQGEGEGESEYRQVAIVERTFTYPGFNYFTIEGDVMLMKFEEPLEMTDYVRPVCLPPADVDETVEYDVCYVTGWGLNENSKFIMSIRFDRLFLQYVKLP